jgi:hypothetical protein
MERYGEMRIRYGLMWTNTFRYVRLRRRYGSMRTAVRNSYFELFKIMAADAPLLYGHCGCDTNDYGLIRLVWIDTDRYGSTILSIRIDRMCVCDLAIMENAERVAAAEMCTAYEWKLCDLYEQRVLLNRALHADSTHKKVIATARRVRHRGESKVRGAQVTLPLE